MCHAVIDTNGNAAASSNGSLFGKRNAVHRWRLHILSASAIYSLAEQRIHPAKIVSAGETFLALPTRNPRLQHHAVTDLYVLDAFPDRGHFPRDVASRNVWHGRLLPGNSDSNPQVEMVQSAGPYAYEHFFRPTFGSGASVNCRTSGPPCREYTIAFIESPLSQNEIASDEISCARLNHTFTAAVASRTQSFHADQSRGKALRVKQVSWLRSSLLCPPNTFRCAQSAYQVFTRLSELALARRLAMLPA